MTPMIEKLQNNPDPDAIDRYLAHIAASVRRQARPQGDTRKRRRRRSMWSMSLNLTPMIDLVFLLLFFFLVVSRFGQREGMLPALLPGRATTGVNLAEIPRTPIRVRLVIDPAHPDTCTATIDRFREEGVPLSGLAAAMRRIREMNVGFDDQTPVHLLAGEEVVWDHVVNAYNAAIAAEYKKIFFAALP